MQLIRRNRREFITLVGGAAAAWPLAARAQQPQRMRHIGVFMNYAEDDPQSRARIASFLQGLEEVGWSVGRNVQIDYRWGVGDAERNRRTAAELIALAPDVILASATTITAALQQTTRSAALAGEASGQRGDSATVGAPDTRPEPGSSARAIPIVFVNVVDPVGSGFVQSMARPGGNATGFIPFEYGMSGRWLELLKQIAPGVTRAAVLHNPIVASRSGQLRAIEALAPSVHVQLTAIGARDPGEIERAIGAFARMPNGGLIVVGAPSLATYHDLIVALAARHRLPAIYPYRVYVAGGGLISYGTDLAAQFRQAAASVDRILKGAKPADLPVQAPSRYELAINRKTASALGLTVPPALLARADEVIE